jgi:hypothetical protein
MTQLTIFVIRAIVGLAIAAVMCRMFFGSLNPAYIVGLAIILVGLAYVAEYFRKRRQ